jgi:predicted phosphodiesterase
MRRFALFSDIHGNSTALDAVLADIERAGLAAERDEVYCLGDLVGYGPDPSGVVRRIRDRAIPTLRGNYDDGIGHRRGECGCYYATEQAKSDGAASYAFTDAALGDEDHDWLAALPDRFELAIEGVRALLVHGSPRKINEYLLTDRPDRQLARLADEAGADLVCVGHIHIPYHRVVTGGDGRPVHYVSTGSAGKPKDGDSRACWVELMVGDPADVRTAARADRSAGVAGLGEIWVATVAHRVAYDVEAVVSAMRDVGLPITLGEALRTA